MVKSSFWTQKLDPKLSILVTRAENRFSKKCATILNRVHSSSPGLMGLCAFRKYKLLCIFSFWILDIVFSLFSHNYPEMLPQMVQNTIYIIQHGWRNVCNLHISNVPKWTSDYPPWFKKGTMLEVCLLIFYFHKVHHMRLKNKYNCFFVNSLYILCLKLSIGNG